MAKKKLESVAETVGEPVVAQAAPPNPSLAKRIADRSGMGLLIVTERLAAYDNDAEIEALLAENDIPTILDRLNPRSKA